MFSDDYYDWTKLAGLEAKAAIQCQQAEIVRLQKRLEALRKAASPVTDNPTEDAFYEKVEASILSGPILSGPTKAGYWRATGPDGCKLLVVTHAMETGVWMAHLADSVHDWPKWFRPDLSVWKDWTLV